MACLYSPHLIHILTEPMFIDEEVVGKLAELDIVTMDLERANARIIQLEKTIVKKKRYSINIYSLLNSIY